MQRQSTSKKSQYAVMTFVVGLLFIFVPIIVSVIVGNQPFPGTVVGPSEVAPVLGMIACIIAALIFVQDMFGY